MGFESLQISEPLKKALSSSVNSGRFPHAAILEDEDSERLMDTAKTLAWCARGTISPAAGV